MLQITIQAVKQRRRVVCEKLHADSFSSAIAAASVYGLL